LKRTLPFDASGFSFKRDQFAGLGRDKDEATAGGDARWKRRHPRQRVGSAQLGFPRDLADGAELRGTRPVAVIALVVQADKATTVGTKDTSVHDFRVTGQRPRFAGLMARTFF
jgi:hypothetical protein